MPDNTEDKSLDVTGVGKVAAAIPKKAWFAVIDTVCTLLRDTVSPITSLTGGIGGFIRNEAEGWSEYRKIHFADLIARTKQRLEEKRTKPNPAPNPRIVIEAIEHGSKEFDGEMRQLWANLLASELTIGGVHPEVIRALSRLTPAEARLLKKIVAIQEGLEPGVKDPGRSGDFAPKVHYEVLSAAGLIHLHINAVVMYRQLGRELLRAVGELPG